MNIEVSSAYVVSGLVALGFTGWSWWIKGKMENVSKLWTKHDDLEGELADYKLHVAETYVNREVLREQLGPINNSLEKIEQDLRELRKP